MTDDMHGSRRRTESPGTLTWWKLGECAPLPPEAVHELIQAYQTRGCTMSRNRVVETHLRLVAKICRRYASHGTPLDDLMGEGSLALVRAVDRFDPTRGVAFASYAAAVVDHAVRDATGSNQSIVRIPGRERRRRTRRAMAENTYFARHGTRAALSDLVSAEEPAQPAVVLSGAEVSLDDESRAHFHGAAALPDASSSPADSVDLVERLDRLRDALLDLEPSSMDALRARFGHATGLPAPTRRRFGVVDTAQQRLGIAIGSLRTATEGDAD